MPLSRSTGPKEAMAMPSMSSGRSSDSCFITHARVSSGETVAVTRQVFVVTSLSVEATTSRVHVPPSSSTTRLRSSRSRSLATSRGYLHQSSIDRFSTSSRRKRSLEQLLSSTFVGPKVDFQKLPWSVHGVPKRLEHENNDATFTRWTCCEIP